MTVRRNGWRQRLCWVIAAATLALAGCATAPTEYRAPPGLADDRAGLNRRVFERAWSLVNEKYFDSSFRGVDWPGMKVRYAKAAEAASDDAALYQVINEMCAELKESHLMALSPRVAHEVRTQHRAALGLRWQKIGERAVVREVTPGGSASEHGVKPGWIMETWNREPLNFGHQYLSSLGKPVAVGFLDEHDQRIELSLEPRLLNFDRLEARTLPRDFVYLRFDKFSTDTLHWLSNRLKQHRDAPGVVIDLRQNSGGNVFVFMIAVAEFFETRQPAGRFVRRSGREWKVKGWPWRSARYRGPVVILTSRGTASAAEIFSHVLQYHQRATLIGQRTGGHVIMSRFYSLPGGGKLQLAIQDYVGLHGKRLERNGVAPDIEVPETTLADVRAGRDAELEEALRVLQGFAEP